MAKRRTLTNPLALAVMVLLAERPMHPYEMARLLRQRGKEHSIKINYGSLYTVVQNLEKHGFVTVNGVQRQGNRPERTLYGLTGEGRTEMHDWLADLVAVPAPEYPAFLSALSLITALHPDEAAELLAERAVAHDIQVAALRGVLAKLDGEIPRIFLIETEYEAHMLEAQADWIRGLLRQLDGGDFSGLAEWRGWHESGRLPDSWTELEERSPATETGQLPATDAGRPIAADAGPSPAGPPAKDPGEPGKGERPARETTI